MFRHQGDKRTYRHNLKLASLLSLVAGIVNITGVLSVKILTTNVTGHFAYFSEELLNKNYGTSIFYLLFILSFLLGAFVSGVLIEMVAGLRPAVSFVVPMIIEIIILGLTGMMNNASDHSQRIACVLLFAMGLQNSLVTKVSGSVVRTTHLTGLFTDLGIELSQLFFYRQAAEWKQIYKSISLKGAIIVCFFGGCVGGGFFFHLLGLKTLLLAAGILLTALVYDSRSSMTVAQKLLAIKTAHTIIWVFFNFVIYYLCMSVITNTINRLTWICLALVFAEGLVLVLFSNICPVTMVARKYSDSTKANFDIFLPEWLARNNKRIYTSIVAVTIALLLWRLLYKS